MTRAFLISVLALACLAPTAQAAKIKVGIAEQNAAFFDDKRWQDLDTPYVRYVISWDAMKTSWEIAETDRWMAAARREHANILVTFGHSRQPRKTRALPSRDEFAHQFRLLRRRYPYLRLFQTWNEANHETQPTRYRPDRVAQYYDAIRRNCPECTVSAPSLLDDRALHSWIQRFRKKARYSIPIWSIHNHVDANRHRSTLTTKFLAWTKGQLWFTETGGIANRWVDGRKRSEYNVTNAGRAIHNVFKLARLSKRVKRIYIYQWIAPKERRPRWDSGLTDPKGKARPSLRILKSEMRRVR
jgi:hypothetical protein